MNQMIRPRPADELERQRRAVRLSPRDARAHAELGLLLLRARELDDGVAALRRALELNPKERGLHGVLAAALFEMGEHEVAVGCYRQALRFQNAPHLHQGLANALLALGRADEAHSSVEHALALAPDSIPVLYTMVSTLLAQERKDEAAPLLRRILALDPNQHDAGVDLARLLGESGQREAALACIDQVLARAPDHVNALRLHALFAEANDAQAALASLERAAALAPDNAARQAELCAALRNRGRLADALAAGQRALALDEANVLALNTLTHLHFMQGEWEDALRLARRALEVAPTPELHSVFLFILSHCCEDPAELTREHIGYGARWEGPASERLRQHANGRDPGRVLRIGLVSGDLFHHAVARFVTPVLEAMKESTQLQLYVYYNNTVEDDITSSLRALAAGWRRIAGVGDDAAEAMIREDAIDILIDLSGHSALNRLPLFARKPAPVQASWIGYAGTTGLRTMDYVLYDRYMIPDARYEAQFTESVVRLPVVAPFLPVLNGPPVNALPALANGYITFGSFHRASKLGRGVIKQWAALLHSVPDARMLLGGLQSELDDVLVDWFAAEGIGRERLILRQRAKMYEYLQQHHEVDVCLSPFPYTGATTVGHAVWMGVPTLATVGATNPSLAAAAYMSHLGLDSFVTDSEDGYVTLGMFLSQNLPALAALRQSMRERFMRSILGYPGVVAAGLELALRRMWQDWCEERAPAPFEVTLAQIREHAGQ